MMQILIVGDVSQVIYNHYIQIAPTDMIFRSSRLLRT